MLWPGLNSYLERRKGKVNELANLLAMVVILGSGIALMYCVRDYLVALIRKIKDALH